jgi:tRNA (guanine26-N2/guanine27-N2)-dimethyltransferase
MSSEPAATAVVQHNGKEYETAKEGLAYILNPLTKEDPSRTLKAGPNGQKASVFYNPIQQFNRDLSVLAIKAYGEHVLAVKKQKAEKRRQSGIANEHLKGKKRKRGHENDDVTNDGRSAEKAAESATAGLNEVDVTNTAASATISSEAKGSDANVSDRKPPSFQILDALSATGLRALRYAKEIPFATCIVSNDLSSSAVQSIKVNIGYNGVDKIVRPNTSDARLYMYSLIGSQKPDSNGIYFGKFDVIDLDPYGTAAPFLDAAVQAVSDGGLLCVTCTDAGVWASTGYPEKSFSLYGGAPLRGPHSHEAGLRLILNGIAISAAKYGLSIEPLLSLSIDFYARVFVRVYRSPAEVKFTSGNTMLVYSCDSGCGAWSIQPLTDTRQKLGKKGEPFYQHSLAQGPVSSPTCEHCGFKTHIGGPMWAGPLHNPHFIQKILDMLPGLDRDTYQTVDRIEGMLTTALEEDLDLGAPSKETSPGPNTAADDRPALSSPIIPRSDPAVRERYPFFVSLSALSKVLHTHTMPINAFRGALQHLGYRSTRSHTKPNSIRTDAPWSVIWEIMREWVRQKSPIKEGALSPGSPGAAIMRKSRENLEEDQWLSTLKEEVRTALESGKDVHDLTTKIEAALYRCGSRQITSRSHTEGQVTSTGNGTEPTEELTDHGSRNGMATPKSHAELKPHPSTLTVVFDEALGEKASAALSKRRIVRYQINPRPNWGPMNRASGS